ncbi:winged helix-turn-helix domain-containing tetratricopeptide repeat protein [Piscinibacter sp.]|uniref:winged helix-turn-helix domain-containing tetratricopeptide repeat protein n=1 Tax=Piscinibacter sp. TaxID=1903157 RepID=UPI0039E4DA4D
MGSALEPLPQPAGPVSFGVFRFDPQRVELLRDGVPVPLRPKAYALLACFLAHPGRVLGKAELVAALWPRVVVTDDSLVQCVADLRAALGDDGAAFITTVPRHGYRFDAPVQAAAPPAPVPAPAHTLAPASPRRPARRLLALGLVSTLALAGWLLWRPSAPAAADLAFAERRSIALLPLRVVGPGTSPEFAEAVADALTGDLARLVSTQVIARPSAAAAAAREGGDAHRIGQALGAAYLLDGSLSRDGEAVELALQFVATDSSAVLWSERWRYDSPDPQAWPRDVSLRVARALDLHLTAAAARGGGSAPRSSAVVDALAQGDALLRRSGAPADVLKARAAFESALAADPRSAHAWSGLALSLLSELQGGWSADPARQTARAAEAVQSALAINPDFPLAHYARGHLLMVQGDAEGALAAYRRVLALNPSDAWSHARVASALLALGRFAEVAAPVEQARRLSPLEGMQVAFGQAIAAAADFHLGRDDAAYAHCREAVQANPSNVHAWALMAAIDALHQRPDAAAQALARLRQLRPQWTVAGVQALQARSAPALQPGQARFVEGLRVAGLPAQ